MAACQAVATSYTSSSKLMLTVSNHLPPDKSPGSVSHLETLGYRAILLMDVD